MFSQWICMSVKINHYTQSISAYMYTEWMAPFKLIWLKFANANANALLLCFSLHFFFTFSYRPKFDN